MDNTAIGEHLVESLLALPWSPCFSLHLDKKYLVVTHTKAKKVKETVRQALDDVLAVKAEELSCVGPEDLASGLGQGHHGEFLNVGFSHG